MAEKANATSTFRVSRNNQSIVGLTAYVSTIENIKSCTCEDKKMTTINSYTWYQAARITSHVTTQLYSLQAAFWRLVGQGTARECSLCVTEIVRKW